MLLQGTFEYRGDLAFTGTGNTEARVSGGQVLIDADGDSALDIAITVTGLTSGSQLVADDFRFV